MDKKYESENTNFDYWKFTADSMKVDENTRSKLINIKADDHKLYDTDYYETYSGLSSDIANLSLDLIRLQAEKRHSKVKDIHEMRADFDEINVWQYINESWDDFLRMQRTLGRKVPLKYVLWDRIKAVLCFPFSFLWLVFGFPARIFRRRDDLSVLREKFLDRIESLSKEVKLTTEWLEPVDLPTAECAETEKTDEQVKEPEQETPQAEQKKQLVNKIRRFLKKAVNDDVE